MSFLKYDILLKRLGLKNKLSMDSPLTLTSSNCYRQLLLRSLHLCSPRRFLKSPQVLFEASESFKCFKRLESVLTSKAPSGGAVALLRGTAKEKEEEEEEEEEEERRVNFFEYD